MPRLPQQDVIHDASTSGVAETSGKRCSAGWCRDTKPKSPQRHGSKIRLPRQRVRNDAATSHPSGVRTSELVHRPKHPSRCTGREVHHDVRNLSAARRLVASVAGSHVTEHPNTLPVLGLVPCVRGLARAFAWGRGDPFGKNCTSSNYDRSYAVTTGRGMAARSQ